ncbi:Uronyl 2-sulfotransferase, putative [Pediculus humanus corporis]|uniref:Uronyl 2-sulfotransferase, putative n=1 Tax=Pediculus humanus subsp. corporis TaxID=121224 RepID=E0VUR8_PEDHC|nr:Uronyl 2-sulfotransferase, putative [Pediculus humanus corporis]EEB17124.1 Uronyl 2-sulfotransferase, putative [Pediculus humanus corporis]
MIVRKSLEKAWFSLLLIGFIFIGVFRIFEDPEKKFIRENGFTGKTTETTPSFSYTKEYYRVTKPLNLARNGTGFSDHVLFFNRVPKSGSEMLVLLLQWLQGPNGFRHVRLPGSEKRSLSVFEQEELVEQITNTEKAEAVPISFDRHVYFINFTKFDKQWPIYVNLIRDPVEKAISRFYYARVTPDIKNPDVRYALSKGLIPSSKSPDKKFENFEDCVMASDPECNFITGNNYDLAIPYFCGQEPKCRILNDEWALRKAKENVENYFPVVGILEELNMTLAVLESKLPMFFKGVQNVYFNELLEPHKNKNKWKPKPPPFNQFVRSHLKNQLNYEYDFYYWIKSRLKKQYENIIIINKKFKQKNFNSKTGNGNHSDRLC